jgi:hypothetical protein
VPVGLEVGGSPPGALYPRPVPMTLAHPAAVLPLRRLGLPMVAMVTGSMVPDVPLLLDSAAGYDLSHSLLGVVTVDLAGTLLLLAVWDAWLRDAFVDLAPEPARSRLVPRRRLGRARWLLSPPAAVVGSLTHVVWDSFTHAHRWGPAHVALLRADLGPLPGYRWAQYLSGVVGLAVVLWAVAAELRGRRPADVHRPRVLPAATLPAAAVAAAAYGLLAGWDRLDAGLQWAAFAAVVDGLRAGVVAAVALGVAWWAASAARGPGRG